MPTPIQPKRPVNPFTFGVGPATGGAGNFGASANPQPDFNFGVGAEVPVGAPATVAPAAADSFTQMIQQFLQQRQQQAVGGGPDLAGLLHEIRQPKESNDLTNNWNIGSQLPSGAGSRFNPFNNPNMFGDKNPDGTPRKKPVASPATATALGAATGGMSNPFATAAGY